MKNLEAPKIWYNTGSQHLYGEQTLRQVAAHSEKIVEELCAPKIGCTKFVVIWKLFGARSFPVAPAALQMTVPNWQIPSDR